MPDALFPDLDGRAEERPAEPLDRLPRLETANRSQIELTPTDLEALLPPGHAARLVWRFVEGLDVRGFYARIAAREGHAGRPAIDPKILLALWLYAISDGVGSAREVDRLCYAHDAYRWLRGGVSVNYHTLSDFRVQHGAALNELLTQSIAALLHRRVITLRRVAQDGMRVRASAGASSFRRRESLQECLRQAGKQVERTARQGDGDSLSREAAAEARAARDREARVAEALAVLPEVAAVKARSKSKGAPRVSTTDPEARVMKMGDGGFRPAYNVEFATDVDGRAIVGVGVTNVGSDAGQLVPMLDQVEARTGQRPDEYLADTGFAQGEALDASAARGVTVYAPPQKSKNGRAPDAPCRGDSPAQTQWRARMATPEAKTIYKDRAATAEWSNAQTRCHRALDQFVVRGLVKVMCWAVWVALAHNMLRTMGIVPHLMS
jgi:transposase